MKFENSKLEFTLKGNVKAAVEIFTSGFDGSTLNYRIIIDGSVWEVSKPRSLRDTNPHHFTMEAVKRLDALDFERLEILNEIEAMNKTPKSSVL